MVAEHVGFWSKYKWLTVVFAIITIVVVGAAVRQIEQTPSPVKEPVSPPPTPAPAPAPSPTAPESPIFPDAKWLLTDSMAEPRRDHTATLLADGTVLIVGWVTNLVELYAPATGTFTETGSSLFGHAQGSTATRLSDGNVLIVGGTSGLKASEIYDPATRTFSATGNLNAVHSYHTTTLLSDGRVLIAGGQDNTGPQTHAVAEIYNPATGTFSLTGSLN